MSGRIWACLDSIEAWLAGALLLCATGLVFISVLLRYFFQYSVSAFDEITVYAIIGSTFIGGSQLVAKERSIVIEILITHLSPVNRRRLKLLSTALGAIFCAVVVVYGLHLVVGTYAMQARSMSALRIPMWIPQLVIPIGAGLMFLRFAALFGMTVRDLCSFANRG